MSEFSNINGYYVKDKKAIRTYDSVSLMKLDTKLNEGQHVKTRGYTSINDGGASEYIIVDDNTLIEDNGYIHTLSNGLKAVLIIKDCVNVKQFGYTTNDYIDLQAIYDVAINFNKPICIDDTYKLNSNVIINDYIEIFGGKLVVDSFESTNNDTFDVFRCNSSCYIHDIEIVSTNDQIPSINRHAGSEVGYASNVKVAEVRSSNCTFERIKGDYIGGIHIYSGDSTNILTNIKVDKCYFNHCEIGMYCENGEFNCTNSTFNQSTDVQSIYYHPFYLAQCRNTNIDNLEIGVNALVYPEQDLTSYKLADIIHLYNSRDNYENDSYNVNISNINIRGDGFKKFAQARFIHDINFSNINGTLQEMLIELGNRFKRVNFNNCNISIVNTSGSARTINNTNSYTLDSSDSLEVNNTTFNYINGASQYFSSCNITFNNCKILSSSNVTLPINNQIAGYLKFNNCYIKLNTLTNLYLGVGQVIYNNCYFDNTGVNNYINSSVNNTLNVKVINCYFAQLKRMFEPEKINTNVCFNVYGYNVDHTEYKNITNFEPYENE